jgi:hypothetical protein
VTASRPDIWSRLARLTPDEVRTRLRQAASKCVDVAMYRVGFSPFRNGLLKDQFVPNQPRGGRFFFSETDVPEIASLLREHLRAEVEEIIREADEICHHRFRLLGHDPLDYGEEIDWHLDAVHGKRAPLKPWFKIRFLDFTEVGDHKVIWELNRHQHLVTLAKAWRLTQEKHYVTELIRQWHGWQRANPYPLGINWGSSLEVAFRSLSWLWVRALLSESAEVPQSFGTQLLQALALGGTHIEKYLSTYFSPNTHLLGEAVALFFIGTLCPQIATAERWRHKGWRIVLEEAQRQVRPDGVYFEQSLYYHVYALDFLLHARQLALRNGLKIPGEFDCVLRKMLDVLQAVSQTGPPHGFGDDDGGRVFNPRRNRAEHMTDPLAIGALALGRDDLTAAEPLTEEAVWLLGKQAISTFRGRPDIPKDLRPVSFEAGGIYVMATSEVSPQMMVIDAGPQGTGRSGHGHADALSVTVSLDGRRWLIDPGTFCYIGEDNQRDFFRGTAAHNTVSVDGRDQAVPEGPFAWSSLPNVHAEDWVTGISFTLFSGSHTGYRRLKDPVLHRRFIFHVHGGFWLVRDVLEGKESHQLEFSWHFSPGLSVASAGDAFIAAPSLAASDAEPREHSCLALLPLCVSAESEIVSGSVSPAYGKKESASVLWLRAQVPLPAQCATLLVPLPPGAHGPGRLRELDSRASFPNSVSAFRYDDFHGRTHCMIFAGQDKPSWSLGPWATDARFLYFSFEGRRLSHFVFCHVSEVKLQEKLLVRHPGIIERFEWIGREQTPRTFSSDEEAVRSFPSGSPGAFEIDWNAELSGLAAG